VQVVLSYSKSWTGPCCRPHCVFLVPTRWGGVESGRWVSAGDHLDKGSPGKTQGRKATGPRFHRDEFSATLDFKTAEFPKGVTNA